MDNAIAAMGMAGIAANPVDHFAGIRDLGADELTPDAFVETLGKVAHDKAPLDVDAAKALIDKLGAKLGIDRLTAVMNMANRCVDHFSREGNDTSNVHARKREHDKRAQWMRLRSHLSVAMVERMRQRE